MRSKKGQVVTTAVIAITAIGGVIAGAAGALGGDLYNVWKKGCHAIVSRIHPGKKDGKN